MAVHSESGGSGRRHRDAAFVGFDFGRNSNKHSILSAGCGAGFRLLESYPEKNLSVSRVMEHVQRRERYHRVSVKRIIHSRMRFKELKKTIATALDEHKSDRLPRGGRGVRSGEESWRS